SDIGLTASTTYYYKFTAVDNAGNIGTISAEQQGTTVPSADTTAQTVVGTIQADGASGVAVNTWIQGAFNEAILNSSVTSSTFTLHPNGSSTNIAAVAWLSGDGKTVKLAPSSNLSPSTIYVATLTTGIKDLAGNAMSTAKIWSFTTVPSADTTPPTVVGTIPADGASGVAVNTWIQGAFNEAILNSSVTSSTFTLHPNGSSTNIAAVAWLSGDGKTVKLAPSSNLSPSTIYVATLTTGIKDLAGNAMSTAKIWSFTVLPSADTTPPAVVGTIPADGANGVAANTWIQGTFNETILNSSVTSSTFTLHPNGNSTNI